MLAAVPVSSSILNLGCGQGWHTEALLRLGFPVHACDPRSTAIQETRARVRELVNVETAQTCVQERTLETLGEVDATFDWVVADRAEVFVHSRDDLQVLLSEGCQLLSPGGWLYLTVPAESESPPSSTSPGTDGGEVGWSTSEVDANRFDADLTLSRSPTRYVEDGEPRLRVLYRHVHAETPT